MSLLKAAYAASLVVVITTIVLSRINFFADAENSSAESYLAITSIVLVIPLWIIALARSYAAQKKLWLLGIFLFWPAMYFFAFFSDSGASGVRDP